MSLITEESHSSPVDLLRNRLAAILAWRALLPLLQTSTMGDKITGTTTGGGQIGPKRVSGESMGVRTSLEREERSGRVLKTGARAGSSPLSDWAATYTRCVRQLLEIEPGWVCEVVGPDTGRSNPRPASGSNQAGPGVPYRHLDSAFRFPRLVTGGHIFL